MKQLFTGKITFDLVLSAECISHALDLCRESIKTLELLELDPIIDVDPTSKKSIKEIENSVRNWHSDFIPFGEECKTTEECLDQYLI